MGRPDGDRPLDLAAAFDEHGPTLLGFLVNGVGDREVAQDCVQETMERAWKARHRYDPERSSARTWLFAIARNVAVDTLRRRGRTPRLVALDAMDVTETAHPPQTAQVEDRMLVIGGLAQLSEEHREVVTAIHLEGLDYAALAERTGVPVGTLRSRMYYALRALRDLMEEDDHGHA